MGKVKFDKLLNKPILHVHDPLYLKDSNGVEWKVTVDTDGALTTALANVATTGQPMGLLLTLTYA